MWKKVPCNSLALSLLNSGLLYVGLLELKGCRTTNEVSEWAAFIVGKWIYFASALKSSAICSL